MLDPKKESVNQLLTGNFNKAGAIATQLSDPLVDTPMLLTIRQLKPYEYNPRVRRNPRYDEIKASILERGLDSPPTVTRRPGDEFFIIRNGGNTRLSILNELFDETGDEQFFRIHCLFKPWQSDIIVITGHLAEGELHGKLTFIERAVSVINLNELYSQGGSSLLSQRQLAERLSKDGFPISQAQISLMQETVNYLLPVIPTLLYEGLSREKIKEILGLRKVAKRIWQKHSGELSDQTYTFDDMYIEILSIFEGTAHDFNLNKYQDELIGQMAKILECSYDLIALAFSDHEKKQHLLDTPPSDTIKIDESTLFSHNKSLNDNDTDIAEQEILAIPLPTTNVPTIKVTRTNSYVEHATQSAKNNQLEEAMTLDNPSIDEQQDQFINQHIVTPAESTPRLSAIQSMVQQFTGEQVPDFRTNVIESIPVQAGGLYPISDIWHISSELDSTEQLRVHIGQLILEIAEELGYKQMIITTDIMLGFTCICQPNDLTGQALFYLLAAFSDEFDSEKVILNITSVITLLTGLNQQENNYIKVLSDNCFVKFIRVLRLTRRFCELKNGW